MCEGPEPCEGPVDPGWPGGRGDPLVPRAFLAPPYPANPVPAMVTPPGYAPAPHSPHSALQASDRNRHPPLTVYGLQSPCSKMLGSLASQWEHACTMIPQEEQDAYWGRGGGTTIAVTCDPLGSFGPSLCPC